MNIVEAITDRSLFGSAFRDAASWQAWRVFLSALFGLPMTSKQLAVFQQCTRRTTAPQCFVTEAWLVCGRQSRKHARNTAIRASTKDLPARRPHTSQASVTGH